MSYVLNYFLKIAKYFSGGARKGQDLWWLVDLPYCLRDSTVYRFLLIIYIKKEAIVTLSMVRNVGSNMGFKQKNPER